MKPLLSLSAICGLTLVARVIAGDSFTDPANAGPDFAIQGEYIGGNCAAQVIALGDGKFHIVGWKPALPGAVAEFEKKADVDAAREGEKVVFNNNGWKGDITNGEIHGVNEDGKPWTLKKTERKSPTLAAKPPTGAVVLFDGTNSDAWKNGKLDKENNLICGVLSKQEFGDVTLHVEFRTPFMPSARGQGRGNSGIYVQDRYECQVLDSFGLKGENNETGGIYSKSKPKLNACFPPLNWQTYDIEFEASKWDTNGKKLKNAVLTVRLNDILVQDKVEVNSETTAAGRKDGPGPGPIQLQNHGTPVVYRNIWVVEKKLP